MFKDIEITIEKVSGIGPEVGDAGYDIKEKQEV
jgi:hypothetical protein